MFQTFYYKTVVLTDKAFLNKSFRGREELDLTPAAVAATPLPVGEGNLVRFRSPNDLAPAGGNI